MRKTVRILNDRARRKMRDAGRQGGLRTVAKHGVEHMRRIGKKGAAVFHSRYKLTPAGTSQFAIVKRDSGEVAAFLDGMPFKKQ